jgi:hypothetical protein
MKTNGEELHMERGIAAGADRRSILKGIGGAALVVVGNAVINQQEAWGLASTSLQARSLPTLIKMARDIYPHARLQDRFYAVAIKGIDENAAKDAKLKELLETGVADLDKRATAAHGVAYARVKDSAQRVAILKSIETTPFFQSIRGSLVAGLYNQKEVWPLFGYEGESASKGGYLERGFSDITWL